MNNSYYIISAIVDDFGKMDNGTDWKGTRFPLSGVPHEGRKNCLG